MWAKRVASTAVVGLLVSLAAPAYSGVAVADEARVKVTTRSIATGLVYKRIQDPAGPWIIHVLTVDPTKAVTMDVVSAGPRMGYWSRTSTMASNAGAIAAINGDFGLWPGRPTHHFAFDSVLRQTGVRSGTSFGYRTDETKGYIVHQSVDIWAKNLTASKGIGVASWNSDKPGVNQVVGFNAFGGGYKKPPGDACSARLLTAGKLTWTKDKSAVYRDYKVEVRACQSSSLAVKDGTTVLSARRAGTGANWIQGMKAGQKIRLTWNVGMPGVVDVIGGNPMLVENGKVTVDPTCTSWFCAKNNPRTAVGLTSTNKVLMVVVDGRKSTSVGMNLMRLAKYMQSLGARSAMNLDGGGSATMWVKGMGIVNDPTDSSGERSVTNALVVLPGRDANEVEPLIAGRGTTSPFRSPKDPYFPTTSREAARAAMDAATYDAASTGGLMDWLLSASGSRASGLPRAYVRIAERFRSAR